MSIQYTYEDFLQFGCGTLKDFLAVRGLPTIGTKVELVARAFAAHEQKAPVVQSTEKQQELLETEYARKLKENGLIDPKLFKYDSSANIDKSVPSWEDNMSLWPPVDLGHIFAYILRVKDFDAEYVGKYKNMKAYSYFQSGFVDIVYACIVSEVCYITSKVAHSQNVNTAPNETWVAMNLDGSIKTAWCSCMAGTSQSCNHVIAVLYKVEYAVAMGFTQPACTSIPCEWNKSTKKIVKPSKILDMNIRKDARSHDIPGQVTAKPGGIISDALKSFDPRRDGHQITDGHRISSFLSKYREINPKAVVYTAIPQSRGNIPDNRQVNLVDMAEIFVDNHEGLNEGQLVSLFLEQCRLSQIDCENIEKDTRLQSECEEWHRQRNGRLTASVFHDIYTKVNTMIKYPSKKLNLTSLVSNIMGIQSRNHLQHVPAVKWGRDHEEQALKAFYSSEATKHHNFKLEKTGLIIDQNRPWLAASPDSILTCKCHGTSVIEIKCPFSIKDSSVTEGATKCSFLDTSHNIPKLNTSHRYYTQIIGQMALKGSSQGYFITWTPMGNPLIDKVNFSQEHWMQVRTNLDIFFKSYILPTVLQIHPTLCCSVCDKTMFHKSISGEESICCDRCGTYSHMTCAKVEHFTKDWICTSCLISMTDA